MNNATKKKQKIIIIIKKKQPVKWPITTLVRDNWKFEISEV